MREKKKKMHDEIRAKFVYTNDTIPSDRKLHKVLIVEDHLMIQETIGSYFRELNERQDEYYFTIDMAFNCQDAYQRINRSKFDLYDSILLDIHLPEFREENLFSGEDIGEWIHQNITPVPKIIIITFLKDALRINSLIKNVKPDALLVKDEITRETLLEAIKYIYAGEPYFSDSIRNLSKNFLYKNVTIDITDRRLLFELSLGSTISELEEALPIKKTAIQNRKNNLMELLEAKSNRELILKARQLGLI